MPDQLATCGVDSDFHVDLVAFTRQVKQALAFVIQHFHRSVFLDCKAVTAGLNPLRRLETQAVKVGKSTIHVQ